MTLDITDDRMSSDVTPHTATRSTEPVPGERGWLVSWLPGQVVDRNQAISALMLAEEDTKPAGGDQAVIQGLAHELGMCGDAAIRLVRSAPVMPPAQDIPAADEPADVVTAERDAKRARLADLADPDCERCDGSGLDPDEYTTTTDADGRVLVYHLTEPCRDCIDEDDLDTSDQAAAPATPVADEPTDHGSLAEPLPADCGELANAIHDPESSHYLDDDERKALLCYLIGYTSNRTCPRDQIARIRGRRVMSAATEAAIRRQAESQNERGPLPARPISECGGFCVGVWCTCATSYTAQAALARLGDAYAKPAPGEAPAPAEDMADLADAVSEVADAMEEAGRTGHFPLVRRSCYTPPESKAGAL